MSMKNWYIISKKLDEEVKVWELIEALLSEEEIESEAILKEKDHWWKFLEQVSSIPIEKLKEEAGKIKERVERKIEREVKYCKLLNIKSFNSQFVSSLIDAYTIRWIYTFQRYNEAKVPDDRHGNKITTLRSYLKKGKISKKEIMKLYKRSCFIDKHIRNGTPDKYSEELIEVDLSKF